MKISAALVAAVLLFQEASALKTCRTGVEKACPKGQICVVPEYSMPGAKGVCGKECNAGTEKPCPKGQECYVMDDTMPGAPGGCVPEDMCFEENGDINGLNKHVMDEILEDYEAMDDAYKNFMHQGVNKKPDMCGGPDDIECVDPEAMCVVEPYGTDPKAWGHCFTGARELGACKTSEECGEGMACFFPTPPNLGAWGWCNMADAKTCTVGAKPCAKGSECISISINYSSTSGSCFMNSMCVPEYVAAQEIMYWEVYGALEMFWHLPEADMLIVRAKINEMAAE